MSSNRLSDDQFKHKSDGAVPAGNELNAYDVLTIPAPARELITTLKELFCAEFIRHIEAGQSLARGLLHVGDQLFEFIDNPREAEGTLASAFQVAAIPFEPRFTEIYTELIKRELIDYAHQYLTHAEESVRMCAMRVYAKSGVEDSRIADIAFTVLLSQLIPQAPDLTASMALQTLANQNLSALPRDKVDIIAGFLDESYSIQARTMACAALGKVGQGAQHAAAAMIDVFGDALMQNLSNAIPWIQDGIAAVVPGLNNPTKLALQAEQIFTTLGISLDRESRREVADYLNRISRNN